MDIVKRLASPLWIFAAALLGSAAGSAILAYVSAFEGAAGGQRPEVRESVTPGMDLVDSIGCGRGLIRFVEVHGLEDGFSRDGEEPARVDPRLLVNGFYRGTHNGADAAINLRDYDELGPDRHFMEYFDLPLSVSSVQLVFRYRTFSGYETDGLRLGDLLIDPAGVSNFGIDEFHLGVAGWGRIRELADGSQLALLDPAEAASLDPSRAERTFSDFLRDPQRMERIDLSILDDTAVDFAALVTCQEPSQHRGVTYREERIKRAGPELSWLSCNLDRAQDGCNPMTGDQLCSVPTPLGCYRSGNRKPDVARLKRAGMVVDSFAGGEVRMTEAVPGERFATVEAANAFCRLNFGQEWRVLSYHEGGAGGIITYSRIAPKSRMWVDIRDGRLANCWDRDRQR